MKTLTNYCIKVGKNIIYSTWIESPIFGIQNLKIAMQNFLYKKSSLVSILSEKIAKSSIIGLNFYKNKMQ